MSSGIRVDPGALTAAGKGCAEAAAVLLPLVKDFADSAAQKDDCFGLVERGSKELSQSYEAFHEELTAFTLDLTTKLGETAVGLNESATRLGGG